MPITITSNAPLEINGAPFTGLMMLSPGPGQTAWHGGCCNAGDCYAVSLVDGIYQTGHIKGAGKCPAEYYETDPVFFEPTASGSYYNLGYRWGNPPDLLANLGVDGCCSSLELELPNRTIDFSEFTGQVKPRGSLRLELATANATIAELREQIEELTATTATATGGDAATQAIDAIIAQAIPVETAPAACATPTGEESDCLDCTGPRLGI